MNSFDFVGFDRSEIEKLLGINLHDNLDEYSWALKNTLPKWMVPYLSRVNISLEHAAYFLADENPNLGLKSEAQTIVNSYKDSLWDAVDSGELTAKDITHYDNYDHDRRDCVLIRTEVESWVTKHNFHWPLPLAHKKTEITQTVETKYLDQWGEFPGKNTALMMIAGMALALEKSSKSFKNGDKLNKLAIARSVAQNLASQNYQGIVVTDKQMTNLIKEALEVILPESE